MREALTFSGSGDAVPLTREFRLLLACARVGSEEEKQVAIERLLADGIDWTLFARIAVAQGFTGFAANTLIRLASDRVPNDILGAFHSVVDEIGRGNRALFNELCRVLETLQRHGIEAIPFKGPVLAVVAYGELGLRQFGDLDFLIHDEDLAEAIAALDSIGYKRTGDLTAGAVCADPSSPGSGDHLWGIQRYSGRASYTADLIEDGARYRLWRFVAPGAKG